MSDNKDLLNKRKQSLLVELESIKHLLDDKPDTIPVLKDTVVEQEITSPSANLEQSTALDLDSLNLDETDLDNKISPASDSQAIEKPSPNNGVLPGQQALFDEEQTPNEKIDTKAPNIPAKKASSGKNLRNNPFLPEHVRKRLDQTSTTLASQEPMESATVHSQNASYTERLVDQLVAQYLPKIEAELRARLLAAVKPKTKSGNK